MRNRRILLTMLAASTLTVGLGAPAQALPNPARLNDDLFTIHLVVPDPANPPSICTISYTPTSLVTFNSTGVGMGTAHETGSVKVSSSGCVSVSWTSVVIVKDEAPTHQTRSKVGTGATAASAAQDVPYASGQREAGVVTIQMLVSSRLGDFCWQDVWGISAFGNPAPLHSGTC